MVLYPKVGSTKRSVEYVKKAGATSRLGYEYAVLVTNTEYEILSLGQLYRDRADAENAFDELKNQWGWGGSPPMISTVAN